MITTESSDEELLDALHKATGELLSQLDPKHCFLTTQAMAASNRVRDVRRIINHSRRQKHDAGSGDRSVE